MVVLCASTNASPAGNWGEPSASARCGRLGRLGPLAARRWAPQLGRSYYGTGTKYKQADACGGQVAPSPVAFCGFWPQLSAPPTHKSHRADVAMCSFPAVPMLWLPICLSALLGRTLAFLGPLPWSRDYPGKTAPVSSCLPVLEGITPEHLSSR
jgi:hypothetical protein